MSGWPGPGGPRSRRGSAGAAGCRGLPALPPRPLPESPEPRATPLLIHGWPGSVVEFQELVGPLTDPGPRGRPGRRLPRRDPVAPRVGFSGPLEDTGWTDDGIAGAFVEVMDRLGYDRYGVQGGDVGAFLAPVVGRQAPSGSSASTDVAIRKLAERDHNVVHCSEFDRGGHFAAMENPEFLIGDVRAFFRRLRTV